ncbi:hypothetical protein BY458DRAFT_512416 [Sporodiniella umbellata]|nr:hypothetical protein BY458DRAFT_512416 [Sporodiniella umbellata]
MSQKSSFAKGGDGRAFDISAKSFIPCSKFDPFKKESEEEEEMEALSRHYLNSNLLDDEQIPEIRRGEKHRWDSFEPYGNNEQEFDPTLQFYHGQLYDASVIEDMHLLKDHDPSLEEIGVENVGEDMSTLQMLQTIFSDLSEPELLETLDRNDYDMDRSIESLLSQEEIREVAEVQPEPRKRQVCRHFLAGECYRKDCWFVHDLQEKVCKFWLQGSCLKGDSCEFSHKMDIQERMANKSQQAKEEVMQPTFDSQEYPALGEWRAPLGKASAMSKPSPSQEDFPSLACAAKIKTTGPGKASPINFVEAIKKKKVSTGQVQGKQKKNVTPLSRKHHPQLKQAVHIPWLETGNALNSTYMKEREKAIEYGTLRNRLFAKATEYYLKGDGSRAKLYSMEAKHYNRLMQEMHLDASRRIFEQRSRHEAFIDLHGLHQDEAIDIIDERLYGMRQNQYNGLVYIVTGTGHHSGDNGLSKKSSKLKPYIEDYLQSEQYRFAETNMVGDTKGGIFAVDLSSKPLK